MEYHFKNYTNSDYDFVYNLKKISYKYYVEDIWGTWNDEQQKIFFNSYISKQKDNIRIIYVNNEKIGFFDDYNIDLNTYEIVNICLLPQFQGKGIGTKILKEKLDENCNRTILIQCFIKNPVVSLYRRLGFTDYEKTATHIKLKKTPTKIDTK